MGNAIVAHTELLDRHPEAVVRFLKARQEAIEYIGAHPHEALELVERALKLDRPVLMEALQRALWYIEVFEDDVKNSWQGASEFLVKRGKIREPVNLDRVIDLSFLGQALGKRYPLPGSARSRYEYARL
jgi:sulfonate transport system substrate-binding protein